MSKILIGFMRVVYMEEIENIWAKLNYLIVPCEMVDI